MKTVQLAAVIVLSITIAMVTTVLIIMSVSLVKKPPACPPCQEVIVEDVNLNIERRAHPLPPLPTLPEPAMGREMEYFLE
jgi:hypothetical protein